MTNNIYYDTDGVSVSADRKYKAIGFDMDGTLLDTAIDYEKLGNAEAYVLSGLGVPSDELSSACDDIDMIRKGVAYLNRNGNVISFDEACRMVNQRASDVEMEAVETAHCFLGVPELLDELRTKGYRIGLLTRGQRLYAESAMGRCGILDRMDAVEAFDDHPTGEQKPNPVAMDHLAKVLGVASKDIIYIGDSVWDYYCARDSGAGFIGIAHGDNGHRKWERVREDVELVENISELIGRF